MRSDADYNEMVEDLLNLDEGLTKWETDFIDSVSKQYENTKSFSPAQREKIDQIYERVMK